MSGITVNGILIVLGVYATLVGVVLPYVAGQYTPELVRPLQRRGVVIWPAVGLLVLFLVSGLVALCPPTQLLDAFEFALLAVAVLGGFGAIPLMWSEASNARSLSQWLVRSQKSDVLCSMLSASLDARDFDRARNMIDAIGATMRERAAKQQKNIQLLFEVGFALWYRGELGAADPRTSDQPNQLHAVQAEFIWQMQRLWWSLLDPAPDTNAIRAYCRALIHLQAIWLC